MLRFGDVSIVLGLRLRCQLSRVEEEISCLLNLLFKPYITPIYTLCDTLCQCSSFHFSLYYPILS